MTQRMTQRGRHQCSAELVSVNRLRADGFQVVERPRPRVRDELSTNYDGVAVVAVPGVRLTRLDVGFHASRASCCVCG